MGLYKYEDGLITTVYDKNFDGSKPEIEYPSIREVIEYIDSKESFEDVEPSVYEALCDVVGVDYSNFDDPDELMDAIKEKVNL